MISLDLLRPLTGEVSEGRRGAESSGHTIIDATVVHRRRRPREHGFRYRVP